MAQKNITVSFPIPVSEKGRIKANDAKKLLKHLAVSNLLKVGTDYFVTDSTGHEEMWSFQKSMDWEHDYEFSCEVFDDDRDFYNCLYFDKKSGKIDYKSCEYEAHLVECAKREKMTESFNGARFEKHIPSNMRFKYYDSVDGMLYWITQEPFDESDEYEFALALGADTPYDVAYVICRDDSKGSYEKDMNSPALHEITAIRDEEEEEEKMNESSGEFDEQIRIKRSMFASLRGLAKRYGFSVQKKSFSWSSLDGGGVYGYIVLDRNGDKVSDLYTGDFPWETEWGSCIWDKADLETFFKDLAEREKGEEPEEKVEESVTLEVYDADGKMIDRQPGFANSAEARDFADWNEDQYPEVHRVVIKYNEAVEEGSDDEFVLNTLEGDLKMLGFHLENQGTTLAYPEYFGEGRDGYMFAERNCNPFLWAVVDVSARPKFCVDIMETDNELQQTVDVDNKCDLSYEEMLDYIKSFAEEETYEEKLTSRLNLINNKLAEAEEGFEEEKLYTGHSVEDIANQLEEEGYVVDTIFGKWLMFSDDDHNKYEAEVTKYYGGEYELSSANIALVPAEEEMDAEYDFDEVDEAENEEGWTEDYKWDGFEDKDFGMRDEWLADAPELEIPEEEIDDVDLRARNEVEAEMYDEKIQEAAALREAVTFKAHHEEFLKKIRG